METGARAVGKNGFNPEEANSIERYQKVKCRNFELLIKVEVIAITANKPFVYLEVSYLDGDKISGIAFKRTYEVNRVGSKGFNIDNIKRSIRKDLRKVIYNEIGDGIIGYVISVLREIEEV